jgi:rhomboid family GlyGly-CTERM serine protease
MLGGALAVALVPRWSAWMVFDRSAILSGQVWRLFTGHWVHFSTRHLVCDAIPLGIAGCVIEAREGRGFGWFCFLTPWIIGAAMLVFEPRLSICRGLSGVASALLALLALRGLSGDSPWRWICAAALLGLGGKILFELATSSLSDLGRRFFQKI